MENRKSVYTWLPFNEIKSILEILKILFLETHLYIYIYIYIYILFLVLLSNALFGFVSIPYFWEENLIHF